MLCLTWCPVPPISTLCQLNWASELSQSTPRHLYNALLIYLRARTGAVEHLSSRSSPLTLPGKIWLPSFCQAVGTRLWMPINTQLHSSYIYGSIGHLYASYRSVVVPRCRAFCISVASCWCQARQFWGGILSFILQRLKREIVNHSYNHVKMTIGKVNISFRKKVGHNFTFSYDHQLQFWTVTARRRKFIALQVSLFTLDRYRYISGNPDSWKLARIS